MSFYCKSYPFYSSEKREGYNDIYVIVVRGTEHAVTYSEAGLGIFNSIIWNTNKDRLEYVHRGIIDRFPNSYVTNINNIGTLSFIDSNFYNND